MDVHVIQPVGASCSSGDSVGPWTSELKSQSLTAKTRKEPPSVLLLLQTDKTEIMLHLAVVPTDATTV